MKKRIFTFYEARRALEILEAFIIQNGKNPEPIISEFEKCGFGVAYPLNPTEIEDFGLSTRAYNALKGTFIKRRSEGETDLEILNSLTYENLRFFRNIGKRTIDEILERKDYILGDD